MVLSTLVEFSSKITIIYVLLFFDNIGSCF